MKIGFFVHSKLFSTWKILFLLLLLPPSILRASPDTDRSGEKHLLVLYSYGVNFAPDFQIQQSFNRSIIESGLVLRVRHVELNSFFPESGEAAARLQAVLPDIAAGKFDCIVVMGQPAVDLLNENAAKIPASIPVVFSGLDVNGAELTARHAQTTGVIGRVSISRNIELGMKLFPGLRRVIVLTDWDVSGRRIAEDGRRLRSNYPGLQIDIPDNRKITLNEMLRMTAAGGPDTLVLFYSWFNRDSTNLASLQYILAHFERNQVRVLSMQEPMLWPGAVGGVFTQLEPIGRTLGERIKALLSGADASALTPEALPVSAAVNYSAVKNGIVSASNVPGDTVLLGAPVLLRPEDRAFFFGGCALIVLLAALLTGAGFYIAALLRRNRKTSLDLSLARHSADQNSKLLQAVFDITPIGLSVKDADDNYKFVMCNRAFSAMAERPIPEMIGHDDFELKFSAFNAATCVSQDKKVVQTGITCDVTEQTHPGFPDNQAFHVMKMPLYLDSGEKMVIGLFMDISEHIALEQQQKSLLEEQTKMLNNSEIIRDCLGYAIIEPDFSKAVSDMLAKIGHKMGADHCDIFAFVNDYKEVECRYSWQFDDELVHISGPRRYPTAEHSEWFAKIRNNEPVMVEDCGTLDPDTPGFAGLARKFKVRSIMLIGIWEDGQLIGIIKVDFVRSKHRFSNNSLKMLQEAVQIYFLAKIRYRQMTEIKERAENAKMTNYCLESILVENRLENTVDKILGAVCARTGGNRALLIHYDMEKSQYSCTAEHVADGGKKILPADSGMPFREDSGWFRRIRDAAAPVLFNPNDAELREDWASLREIIERNAIYRVYAIGLREKGVLNGSLCITFEGEGPIGASDRTSAFFTAAAHLLELLFERVAARRALEHALEQALAADKAKSFFLGSVSHEIRTPLNSVLGFSELLLTGTQSDEERHEYLLDIHSSGKALLQLVDDVLDLSALETGNMVFHPEPTDFPALLDEVAAPFRKTAEAKDLTFECQCKTMPRLMLDRKRMGQILWNLLDNAVKFTRRGKISIACELRPEHNTLAFHVSDTGVGIDAKDVEKLFQPFVQLSRTRGTAADNFGTGLGLVVIRRMIEQMNGKASLVSQPGVGSDFGAELYDVAIADTVVSPTQTPSANFEKKSVLVVDDVALNRKVLAAILKKFGIVPAHASGGADALEFLRSTPVDLVLTDLWMPEMNGAELAAAIRKAPENQKIKIFAITADADASANFSMKDFDGILYKPVTPGNLEKLLGTAAPQSR